MLSPRPAPSTRAVPPGADEARALALAVDLPARSTRGLLRALHEQLRGAILDGRLAAGLQLPSSRALALQLRVSRNTVVSTYDLLLSEGYLVARPGAGTFVASISRRARPVPRSTGPDARLAARWRDAVPRPPHVRQRDLHDFRLGVPDTTHFPFDTWRRLLGRSLRELARSPAAYEHPAGLESLRAAIGGHISFARAVACRTEDIVVTGGAQGAFDLLARVLVTPGKTVVAVEDPGYPYARASFATAGALVRAVPVDDEGLIVDQLPSDARVVYVTPSHQFPLGVPLSPARRAALLRFAARHNAVIIEDDYDGEFRYEGRPLDALQTLDDRGCVFYVGTFSKSLFPALRQGFLVAPPWATDALMRARQIAGLHGPWLEQRALSLFIGEGHLARCVRRMRRIYDGKRRRLLSALERHCGGELEPLPTYAGLHMAARLSHGTDADAVVVQAAQRGIVLESLTRYSDAKPGPMGLVFGYGLLREEHCDDIARSLAAAIRAAR